MATVVPFPGVNPEEHIPQKLELVRPLTEDVFDPNLATTVSGPYTAHIGGAAVNFSIETPAVVLDEVPVLIVQGFMGPELVYEDLRHAVAGAGRIAITMGRAGPQNLRAFLDPRNLLRQERLTSQSPYAVVKTLREEHGIDYVDAAGHSMAGPILSNIAYRKRQDGYFRSLNLLGSAGLTRHTPRSLAERMPHAAAEIGKAMPYLAQRYGAEGAKAIIGYFFVNPIRPGFEAWSVARANILDTLPRIEEAGVPVSVGAFAKDCFFDEEVVEKETQDRVSHFTVIDAERAGHIAPQTQSELVGYDLLTMMSR